MAARPCLDCQRLTRNGSRCEACAQVREQQRDRRRGNPNARGYTRQWRKAKDQVIDASPICVICGHTGSPDNPLTGDHIRPKHLGGQPEISNIQVLCRVCNSRKGGKIG